MHVSIHVDDLFQLLQAQRDLAEAQQRLRMFRMALSVQVVSTIISEAHHQELHDEVDMLTHQRNESERDYHRVNQQLFAAEDKLQEVNRLSYERLGQISDVETENRKLREVLRANNIEVPAVEEGTKSLVDLKLLQGLIHDAVTQPGNKLILMRDVRRLTGLGLKQARDLVYEAHNEPEPPTPIGNYGVTGTSNMSGVQTEPAVKVKTIGELIKERLGIDEASRRLAEHDSDPNGDGGEQTLEPFGSDQGVDDEEADEETDGDVLADIGGAFDGPPPTADTYETNDVDDSGEQSENTIPFFSNDDIAQIEKGEADGPPLEETSGVVHPDSNDEECDAEDFDVTDPRIADVP